MNTSKFDSKAYEEFLRSKIPPSSECGFPCTPDEVGALFPILKPHQRDMVAWMVRRGRGAIFAAFGLGKTMMQLAYCFIILQKAMAARKQSELFPFCRALIVAPLGVRQEFKHDAEMLGLSIKFVRRIEECEPEGLYLTNYETVPGDSHEAARDRLRAFAWVLDGCGTLLQRGRTEGEHAYPV